MGSPRLPGFRVGLGWVLGGFWAGLGGFRWVLRGFCMGLTHAKPTQAHSMCFLHRPTTPLQDAPLSNTPLQDPPRRTSCEEAGFKHLPIPFAYCTAQPHPCKTHLYRSPSQNTSLQDAPLSQTPPIQDAPDAPKHPLQDPPKLRRTFKLNTRPSRVHL